MARFVAGQGKINKSTSIVRGFIPRFNETDSQTRKNRDVDRHKSIGTPGSIGYKPGVKEVHGELLPSSTAIINVYQLVDKVKKGGAKFKAYYPSGIPGVGFAGFTKIRGVKDTNKITGPVSSIKPERTVSSEPPSSDAIKLRRAENLKFAPKGYGIEYRDAYDKVGSIVWNTKLPDKENQKLDSAYRAIVVEQLKLEKQKPKEKPVETPASTQEAVTQEQIKKKSAKTQATSSLAMHQKQLFGRIKQLRIPYSSNIKEYEKNGTYFMKSLGYERDIQDINKYIDILENEQPDRKKEIPPPLVAVGTTSQSILSTQWVYIKKDLVSNKTKRKKHYIVSKTKRPIHKSVKRKVILKKKGGKR